MAFVIADRVKETSTTVGTGTFTLAGAASGFQSFSAIGNSNTTFYTITLQGGTEWEVGIGTYTSSGTTLSRDTVLASSAGGTTKVTFSAGTKDVFVTYPAKRSVSVDDPQIVSDVGVIYTNNGTVNTSTTLSVSGMSVGSISIATGKSVTVANGQKWVVL